MTIQLSDEQQAILDAVMHGTDNIAVNSVAGSGKTTIESLSIRSVLTQNPKVRSVGVAFGKDTSKILTARVGVETWKASTMHSIGYHMVKDFLAEQDIRLRMNEYKYWDIVDDMLKKRKRKHGRKEGIGLKLQVNRLASLARLAGVDWESKTMLQYLVDEHGLSLESNEVIEFTSEALEIGYQMAIRNGVIDFTDMLYLPIHLDLEAGTEHQNLDWVFIDEVQDFSDAQRNIAAKLVGPNTRVMVVGDPNQSIMGFAGADNESFDKTVEEFDCKVMEMSYTRRCPKSHVRLAQELVPHMKTFADAPDGRIMHQKIEDLLNNPIKDSLVISRFTYQLVGTCLQLIQNGVGARVLGKDIGKNLIGVLRKATKDYNNLAYADVPMALQAYELQETAEMENRKASQRAIMQFEDNIRCLKELHRKSHARSIEGLNRQLDEMFSDEKGVISLSTIHRQKGNEAKTVYFIGREELPYNQRQMQYWQSQQERNVLYVGLTRSEDTMIFLPSPKEDEEMQRAKANVALEAIPADVQAFYAQQQKSTNRAFANIKVGTVSPNFPNLSLDDDDEEDLF